MKMIRAAAETFALTPRTGAETTSLTGATVRNVFSPLKTTVTLLEDGKHRICIVTSHFVEEFFAFSNLRRRRVAEVLGIAPQQVFVFASHNHSDVNLGRGYGLHQYGLPRIDAVIEEDDLTADGRQVLENSVETAARLPDRLVPVDVGWAVGHERRLTYNRKGRRADGSTYLMREEDRVLLGQDFNGDIDDEAPVIAFQDRQGKPVCFLVQFTGHPATAYHPEDPVVFGEYAQVACDELSAAFAGVPVGFLQGCAGETNSKGLITDRPASARVADAARYGHYLGETYREAAGRLQQSRRGDLGTAWEEVKLPFQMPSEKRLRAMLAEIDGFLERCARGDDNARVCMGINVPKAFSPKYRMALVEPTRKWAQWALSFHTEERLQDAPGFVRIPVGVLRLGDVGLIGMLGEPLLGIGRQIKRGSPLPLTVPCGYMHDSALGYIPDSPNNGDLDYQSSFYRYTTSLLPYRNPAGDLLARAGLHGLRKMTKN